MIYFRETSIESVMIVKILERIKQSFNAIHINATF